MTIEKKCYEYEVVSAKYGIKGIIADYNVVIKLIFEYNDRKVEMALCRPFPFSNAKMKAVARETIDSYIENYKESYKIERKTKLHYWYVDMLEWNDKEYVVAHGNVSGHKRLLDTTFIRTSEIQSGVIDKENGELVIITSNTKYYCPLEYCQWEKQDKFADLVPEYEWIKRNYKGELKVPEIEENKVLLVLSNFDKYYYHGTYCTLSSKKKVVHFCGCPHVGTFQDSFIISSTDSSAINIRYFPHYQNIKFYSEITDGMPLFVENIGDVLLYVDAHIGLIKLEPGERKEVRLENIEQERPVLPSGDLYPAEIIE